MEKQTPQSYDSIYKTAKSYRSHYRKASLYRVWQWIVKYTRQIEDPKILEIGCGSGQLAHFLYDEGFKNYGGFDFSEEAINLALKTVDQEFWVGDVNYPENYDRDYNVVIASEVLEHLPDDKKVLRMIPPGKKIIFSVPRFPYHNHYRHFVRPVDVTLHYIDSIHIRQLVTMPTQPYWHIGWGIIK